MLFLNLSLENAKRGSYIQCFLWLIDCGFKRLISIFVRVVFFYFSGSTQLGKRMGTLLIIKFFRGLVSIGRELGKLAAELHYGIIL